MNISRYQALCLRRRPRHLILSWLFRQSYKGLRVRLASKACVAAMSGAISPASDDVNTLVDNKGRSTTVTSQFSIPKHSFSPRVSLRRPQSSSTRPRGGRMDFAELPALSSSSAISLPWDSMPKNESLAPPPRITSCPIPLLLPPTNSANTTNNVNTNNMATATSFTTSSTNLSSSLSQNLEQVPYAFPTRQPQPDRDALPASCRPGPKANRVTRDRPIARQAAQRHSSSTNPRNTLRPRSTPTPTPSSSSPLELVYSIRTETFTLERRSGLLPRSQGSDAPMLEMQENMPPLLVDGRMTVVNIPKIGRAHV